jgi:hypothetical protein
MSFEKFFKQDSIDQSQQSSSHSRSPERLQQLRQAHRYQSEQNRKGKGIMSVEVQEQYNQTKRESLNDNYQAAIREIIKQRGGKSSSDSEISLGYQEGLRGGGKLTDGNWNTLSNSLISIREAFNNNDQKNEINTKLKNLKEKVDKYIKKSDRDDYTYLGNIHQWIPKNADDAAFLDGIRICLDYVNDGKKG